MNLSERVEGCAHQQRARADVIKDALIEAYKKEHNIQDRNV